MATRRRASCRARLDCAGEGGGRKEGKKRKRGRERNVREVNAWGGGADYGREERGEGEGKEGMGEY